jgi:glycosyltransferase involved in cell wall biosynthesis
MQKVFGFSRFGRNVSLAPVNKLPITVSIISGAEASRIGRALESVAGWTSEIIVVLNEDVRDGTEEIAKKHGARVFREPWKGHVAQKNSALAKATQDWVLGLDADEAVSPGLRDEITTAVGGKNQPSAYSVPRLNYYCGRWIRHGDWYPDRKTRLWRRGMARWEGEDPHDRLVVDGPVEKLRGDLLHYPMETINHQVAKTIKYADDFVRNCAAQKQSVSFLDLLVRPPWRFLRSYVFKLGFLDGWQGFSIAWMTSFYTFLRYVKVREAELPKETGQ